ncbi:MAG TPA: tRNA 2-thiouridine(34) synthase MnmA [Desulfobulbaceae bacterium]|nr:tRNA 2-thiouridine(34) synthase MnmA [Desulfobulbaceae bacterium]
MTREKIGIAMSGGVDSLVAASLLQGLGLEVHGFFMRLPLAGGAGGQVHRVQTLAGHLRIPLHIIDMRSAFSKKVISYFVQTYLRGWTPNPCVICNEQVKFGVLLREMRDRGMARMATGHYARISRTENGVPILRRGLDPGKDQSYFLCRLHPDTLSHLVLPLGEATKKDVYRLAAEMSLEGFPVPESQDVCFLAGSSVADFIAAQGIPEQPGDIVTDSGKVIGRHHGLWRYTIGQRRGLDLPDASPWYVHELDARHNRLLVCKKEQLMTGRALLSEVRWLGGEPLLPWQGLVQIRGRHTPALALLSPYGAEQWQLEFARPQLAVTPGQFAVFYEDDAVLGSGIIAASGGGQ